jgi:site-specific recombinase XerD
MEEPMALEFSICKLRWERYERVSENPHGRQWLEFQAARGLAANTLDAYGRDLDAYLRFLLSTGISFSSVVRSTLGAYIRSITELPAPRVLKDGRETRTTLSNATLQQHLTVVRLFHDFLVEENICTRNPLRPSVGGRSLIQRHHRLPWIPSEEEWLGILQVCQRESLRNRVMLAMSYDAGLRREEICSLETTDIDPAHRLLRIRLEATKGRRERVIPYSVPTSELFGRYLSERRKLSRERGPLFLSESNRNQGKPISIWTWSKVIARVSRRCNLPRFTPHTLRHLCLTDLARANWDIHEIATFAGHRNIQTTMLYIHLSGRDLAKKLARGMAEVHALRVAAMHEVLGC